MRAPFAALSLSALLLAEAAFAGPPGFVPTSTRAKARATRVYDLNKLDDHPAIARVIKKHVAYVRVDVARGPNEIAGDAERDGFGIVLEPTRIAILCFVVENASRVTVQGPTGTLPAKVTRYDVERRVAVLETAAPLSSIGLEPAAISPVAERHVEDTLFALVSTSDDPAVLSGWIIHLGDEPEYEGFLRVNLKLRHGMPIFDDRARFIGYARAVAWDVDPHLVVTPEMIAEVMKK